MTIKITSTKIKFTGKEARDLMRSNLLDRSYNARPIRYIYTPVPSFDKPLTNATEITQKVLKKSNKK